MEQHGDNFKSRIGVLLALAGSAIGLGNLWRFPYLLGTNGGAAFIIIYLFFVFIICLPIMFSEFTIGRRSGANAFRAFRKLSPGSKWNFMGIFVVLTPILVVSFYSVVGGWTIDYMVKAATGVFSGTSQQLSSLFSDTISSPLGPIIYMLVFLALSCLVGLVGLHAVLDVVGHLSKVHELIADNLIVCIQSDAGDITLGHLQITGSLCQGAVHGTDLRAESLAQILKSSADGKTFLRECALRSSIHDL